MMKKSLNGKELTEYWKKEFMKTDIYKDYKSYFKINLSCWEKLCSIHFNLDNFDVGFNIDCRFENESDFTIYKWNEEDTHYELTDEGFKAALEDFKQRAFLK